MKLIKSQTYQNLARAFAGECMARTRYEFIEYGARNEGYKNIAEIIDGIAYQEFNHATDPEMVESCIYQISAVKARCNYLIRSIKAHSGSDTVAEQEVEQVWG